MNYNGRIIPILISLTEVFIEHCEDDEILKDLQTTAKGSPGEWRKARGLFQRARDQNRGALTEDGTRRKVQGDFEEICAKTLYNLSGGTAPYDPDSPFWVVPNAFALAEALGLSKSVILEILDSGRQPLVGENASRPTP